MNHVEVVEGRDTWFFFNHGIYNVMPLREFKAMGSGIMEAEMVGLP